MFKVKHDCTIWLTCILIILCNGTLLRFSKQPAKGDTELRFLLEDYTRIKPNASDLDVHALASIHAQPVRMFNDILHWHFITDSRGSVLILNVSDLIQSIRFHDYANYKNISWITCTILVGQNPRTHQWNMYSDWITIYNNTVHSIGWRTYQNISRKAARTLRNSLRAMDMMETTTQIKDDYTFHLNPIVILGAGLFVGLILSAVAIAVAVGAALTVLTLLPLLLLLPVLMINFNP
eukprot:33504_1